MSKHMAIFWEAIIQSSTVCFLVPKGSCPSHMQTTCTLSPNPKFMNQLKNQLKPKSSSKYHQLKSTNSHHLKEILVNSGFDPSWAKFLFAHGH